MRETMETIQVTVQGEEAASSHQEYQVFSGETANQALRQAAVDSQIPLESVDTLIEDLENRSQFTLMWQVPETTIMGELGKLILFHVLKREQLKNIRQYLGCNHLAASTVRNMLIQNLLTRFLSPKKIAEITGVTANLVSRMLCRIRKHEDGILRQEVETSTPRRDKTIACQATFRCPACAKEFSDYRSLPRHHKKYHGVKPFKCPYCPYRAILRGHYEAHVANHESKSLKEQQQEWCRNLLEKYPHMPDLVPQDEPTSTTTETREEQEGTGLSTDTLYPMSSHPAATAGLVESSQTESFENILMQL